MRSASPAVAANPHTASASTGDGLSKRVNSRAAGAAPTKPIRADSSWSFELASTSSSSLSTTAGTRDDRAMP
jgi:hypothetical protein